MGRPDQPTNPDPDLGQHRSGASSYEYCYDMTNDSACSWMGEQRHDRPAKRSAGWRKAPPTTGRCGRSTMAARTYANGLDTAYWSFTTATTAAGDFSKTNPANGATGQPTNPDPDLGQQQRERHSYEYCYDMTNDSACADGRVTGTSTSTATQWIGVRHNVLLAGAGGQRLGGTTYSNGLETAFWSFTTATTPPGDFNKLTPANGATGQPTNPDLDLGQQHGVSYYEYCYDMTNDSACTGWAVTGTSTSTATQWTGVWRQPTTGRCGRSTAWARPTRTACDRLPSGASQRLLRRWRCRGNSTVDSGW